MKTRFTGRAYPIARQTSARVFWTDAGTTDRQDLCFGSGPARYSCVTIRTEPAFSVSDPELLIDFSDVRPALHGEVMLPDGRFLAIQEGEHETDPTTMRVELNWTADLERRLREGN